MVEACYLGSEPLTISKIKFKMGYTVYKIFGRGMFKMEDVCYNCQNRELGCHSRCERYNTAKAKHLQKKAEIRKSRETDWAFTNYVKESIAKGKRKHAIR